MYRDLLVFLKAWVRSPRKIGAVIPSSPMLAKAMAELVKPEPDKTVLEIGAGTGSVTQALLKHGVRAENLVVIESDPIFCKRLRLRFPGVHILNVDATRLLHTLQRNRINTIGTVVSSLPLLTLERNTQDKILEQAFSLLGENGTFIQYTYGIGSPIRTLNQRHLDLEGHRVRQIWLNIPPATVWKYQSRKAIGEMS